MKKTLHKHPQLLIEELIGLEKCGKYEKAVRHLEYLWEDISDQPMVEDYDLRTGAEIILRCGSLIGFLGHNKQIPKAQVRSKNLLTQALEKFRELEDIEKIAECENYLALAYWRTGELVESEIWIDTALSHNLSNTNEVKLYSFLIKSMILFANGKFKKVRQNLENAEGVFQRYGDAFLKGSYYTNLSLALKNLGNTADALKKLELAKYYHQKSGHQIYLGTVENNFAQIYRIKNDFAKAHRAVDNAINIYNQIEDKTREGSSLDTKAQIYFAEEKFAEALETAERSIEILEKSENFAYLVESYLTKTKILISIDDISSATLCLFDAVHIAKTKISEDAAKNLVKEFEFEIRQKNSLLISGVLSEKELINEDFELILPPSIANYSEYQAVRIRNNHLEKIGLKPNSLAIVVNEKVERGDLAAITEIKDGSVLCGFYDTYFGIICLEGIDSEPQLLNEDEIKILGKIVGVCDMEKNSDGKLPVNVIERN